MNTAFTDLLSTYEAQQLDTERAYATADTAERRAYLLGRLEALRAICDAFKSLGESEKTHEQSTP